MVTDLKLPLGSRCIKYLLFIFNFLFVISGIILLSVGATIRTVYSNYNHFLDDKFFSVPSLLIVIGSIIFFIAFFGCCGAVRENYCMIVTFCALMVLVFILELSGGISGYVLRNNAAQMIEAKMKDNMEKYKNNETEIKMIWDDMQTNFECCGAKGPDDWLEHNGSLPISCCPIPPGQMAQFNCNNQTKDVYRTGCVNKFGSYVKDHAIQLGGAGLGIAFYLNKYIHLIGYLVHDKWIDKYKIQHNDFGIKNYKHTLKKNICVFILSLKLNVHFPYREINNKNYNTATLTGVMIISVGMTIYTVYDDFRNFLDPRYSSPAMILIFVGGLIFVIAFFGCYGAIRESTCMVLTFAVSLSVVLVLEISAAIAAYALRGSIKSLLAENINLQMQLYKTSDEAAAAIDFLQSRLQCCGNYDKSDWEEINLMDSRASVYPDSCFSWISSIYNPRFNNVLYEDGCIQRLSMIINQSAISLGTGAFAIVLIQFTGVMFACTLGRAIRRQKTERERRRWELREKLINGYQPLGKVDSFVASPVIDLQAEPVKYAESLRLVTSSRKTAWSQLYLASPYKTISDLAGIGSLITTSSGAFSKSSSLQSL
ncbi:GSCOCG00008896001-RA-CDS [Cotesia congregata]|nr:GSCOCG00008896001-RA-CDS [Cotesia congregata]